MVTRVVVSGAGGFIGHALTRELIRRGVRVTGFGRRPWKAPHGADTQVLDLAAPHPVWPQGLHDAQAVVHLASLVHLGAQEQARGLAKLYAHNVEASLRFARAAAAAGVRRFVHVSTIGVHGPVSHGTPLDERSPMHARTPYARSKWQAEQALRRLCADTDMELVIVRPPLVYGPQAPGNLGRLLAWIEAGRPLPLGGVANRRTLIARDNLVDFLIRCVDHPAAGGQDFVVADREDVSTPDLVRHLAHGMQRPARLWPVPVGWLRIGARLTGRRALFQQLCADLQVDASKARRLLGWTPPLAAVDALHATGRDHVDAQ